MILRRCLACLAALMLPVLAAGAQTVDGNGAYLLGHCPGKSADSTAWAKVVDAPDVAAQLLSMPRMHPPLEWRDKDGNYAGKVVLAFAVDVDGSVIAGTSSIEESNDARLSKWACGVVGLLRFTPAAVAGKPVVAMKEQPLSYYFGDKATFPATPLRQ